LGKGVSKRVGGIGWWKKCQEEGCSNERRKRNKNGCRGKEGLRPARRRGGHWREERKVFRGQ